jgi:hypothetical protein
MASTARPFRRLVMRIGLWQRRPPAYHLVDSATMSSLSLWYLPSHADGPPPDSPFWNPFIVMIAGVPPRDGRQWPRFLCFCSVPAMELSSSLAARVRLAVVPGHGAG